METRLPTHLEIAGWLRSVQGRGGFGTVLKRGERSSGTVLLLTVRRGADAILWERMPQLDGGRLFVPMSGKGLETGDAIADYLARRTGGDPDLWVVEIDTDDPSGFVTQMVNRVDSASTGPI